PGLPCGKVGAAETDMVQTGPELAEALVGRRVFMLVYSQQGAAVEDPHQVTESGSGVFVDHRVDAEQPAVPRSADGDVADGQRDVVEGRKCHDSVFLSGERASGGLKCDPARIGSSRGASATFTSSD